MTDKYLELSLEELNFLNQYGKFMLKEMPKSIRSILLQADRPGTRYQVQMIIEEVVQAFAHGRKYLMNMPQERIELYTDWLTDYLYTRMR